MNRDPDDGSRAGQGYNYVRFDPENYDFDEPGKLVPGDPMPEIQAETVDGEARRLSELAGQPVVLETGSMTCPIYIDHVGPMNELADRFPGTRFIVLYTREAHPGERTGPHASMEDKVACAGRLLEEEPENREVWIDDLQGTAHRALGGFPDSVHVVDADGRLAYQATWNDPEAVEAVLEALARGISPEGIEADPDLPPSFYAVRRAFVRGGWLAVWDWARAMPKLALERPGRR